MAYANLISNQYINRFELQDAFNKFKFYPSVVGSTMIPSYKWLTKGEVTSFIDQIDLSRMLNKTSNQLITKLDLVEQALVFTEFTNFVSPSLLYYYNPSGTDPRLYILDLDQGAADKYLNPGNVTKSNIYWINPNNLDPNNLAVPPTKNYVGNVLDYSYCVKIDPLYNRLYLTGFTPGLGSGDTTTGLKIYDIATNTTKNIYYDSNTIASRLSINILADKLIVSSSTGTYKIPRLPNLADINSSILVNFDIRVGLSYSIANRGSDMVSVGNNLWVISSGSSTIDPVLGIFNDTSGTDFTLNSFISTFDITNDVTTGFKTSMPDLSYNYTRYNRSLYYDIAKNKMYLSDLGSNTITVFNTLTNSIIGHYTFTKNTDFNITTSDTDSFYYDARFVVNERSGDLMISGRMSNRLSPTAPATEYKSFLINRDCTDSSNILSGVTYSLAFNQLVETNSSRFLYGAISGDIMWTTGAYTAADGKIIQYGRIVT